MKKRCAIIHALLPHPDRIPYLCLYLAGIVIFLFLTLGCILEYTISPIYRLAMLGACTVFTVFAFAQAKKDRVRYPFPSAIAMVVWFFVILLVQFSRGIISHHYTLLPPVYLLAFPFAAVAKDEKRQAGLKAVALLFVGAILFWVLDTFLLMADCLPQFLQKYVLWNGTRLNVFFHSNICARGFMLGIGFSLALCVRFRQKRVKLSLLAAAALMFAALSLTNSRSVVLITCLFVSGIVFFSVFRGHRTRLASGIAAAAAAAVTLLLVSQTLFQWNSDRLTAKQTALWIPVQQEITQQNPSPEPFQPSYKAVLLSGSGTVQQAAPTATRLQIKSLPALSLSAAPPEATVSPEQANGPSEQDSFIRDLPSLNSRTTIWRAAFKRLQEEPSILIWGTNQTELKIWDGTAPHTHNSWLEVLFRLGLPGFLLSLVFTLQALWSSAVLLLRPQTDLWKQSIVLLVLCIMFCSFLEPSLFFSPYSLHFVDFVFFLCLGYLIQWRKEISP